MSNTRLRSVKVISVVAGTVISLACGTNYAYSAWAPAFAEKLKLSSTQSNLIGTFGNLGMYTAGVPVGLLVDTRGPRPGALLGAMALGVGYFSMHRAYESGPHSIAMPWLCFFAFLTGIGGCAAFAGAIKTSALNWPNHRGSATAFPLSAFGLSAFFFSAISSLAFPDNTSDLLLLLSVATVGMVLVGSFFLRVVPSPQTYTPLSSGLEHTNSNSSAILKRPKSGDNRQNVASLSQELGTHIESSPHRDTLCNDNRSLHGSEDPDQAAEETSTLLSKSSESTPGDVLFKEESTKGHDSHHLDIRGLTLLWQVKFYQLWILLGILTGIGLMTINNIGSDARALWHHYDDSASPEFIQEQQLMHVEILSIMSFCGRFTSGVGSDIIVTKLGMSRFWCLFFSSVIFLIAQICAARIENPHILGFLSGLTGLGYGFLFGVFPALVAEAFGVNGLSQNWGWMTLSPILFGNLFNLIYGSIYDGHSILLSDGQRDCKEGRYCYQDAYWITMAASFVAIAVSSWCIHYDWASKVKAKRDMNKGREA